MLPTGKVFPDGNSPRVLGLDELEANLAALSPWNLKFEVPDVIAFADFIHCRRLVAESLFASQRVFPWDRALLFPYPNGRKLRQLTVLGAPDLALLRASAGRILGQVEPRLSPRSFGYRAKQSGSSWGFGDTRAEWKQFTDSAIALLQSRDINAMCSTDVANYYASIDLDRLETRLLDLGCDLHAVTVMLAGLRKWSSVDKIAGLPIGPEASGVLGNAFLNPIDLMLMSVDARFMRWMDDYKVMGPDVNACRSVVSSFDQFLRTQGLTRSVEKTLYYANTVAAIASLRDGKLASLGYSLDVGVDRPTQELRAAFDRFMVGESEVVPSKFRFILRALKNRRDDFAAAVIAGDPDLANIDPHLSGDYLASVGLSTQTVVDAMLAQLNSEPADETEALALHFLRALTRRRGQWGEDEGHLFQSIAESACRRPPVRCWAVQALSRTSLDFHAKRWN